MIFCGDTHFTDNARDAYRFGLFPWLREQQKKWDPAVTFLAGDITDAKDRHSASLVNKIVEGLLLLKPPVYICMGNHDYRDPNNPFFKFLNHIDGIRFITEPCVTEHGNIAIIPHYRTQADFDAAVRHTAGCNPSGFLIHQTFDGAIAETGARLSGLSASLIESVKAPLGVYAGDVHRPQRSGKVTYIGCPYHVRFGDNFSPRVIKRDGTFANLTFPAPFKWALTIRDEQNILTNKELCRFDQVKLTVELTREEVVDWKGIKKRIVAACRERELEIHGVKLEVSNSAPRERIKSVEGQTSKETYLEFCRNENIGSDIKKAGLKLLQENGNGQKNVL
jgi:hypothetical protein